VALSPESVARQALGALRPGSVAVTESRELSGRRGPR